MKLQFGTGKTGMVDNPEAQVPITLLTCSTYMPNITQKKLDGMLHAAWIKGAACALAHVAEDHRQPTVAAETLIYMMQSHHLKLAEHHDRNRLKKSAEYAWPNVQEEPRRK